MNKLLQQTFLRNRYSRNGEPIEKGKVNLEYFHDSVNLGDQLSPVICRFMLEKKALSPDADSRDGKIRHLMAVGSILGGRGTFDACVWGSGIRNFASIRSLSRRKVLQKLDIRAVRGPLTRQALRTCGYTCPEVYGDPAVLMPLIYQPTVTEKKGTALVLHYKTKPERLPGEVSFLDIATADYQTFIDGLAGAEKVISSSLHGIILAESYGIPAVLLRPDESVGLLKFYDWYHSTGRWSVHMAQSLEEALEMPPMPLPDLTKMQERLMACFPYDLWS